jgi:hypothetical protein
VPTVDLTLARRLQTELRLERAVETGTYLGGTTRALAGLFPSVVTIERSEELHREATLRLQDLANVQALQGHSVDRLPEVVDVDAPTLYFLDGHWSDGVTAGADDECPVLRELRAIGAGHPGDCLVIDDARLFMAAPPPPHDPTAWPTLLEVLDAVRTDRPNHHVTILEDQILAVPQEGRGIVDAHGQSLLLREQQSGWREQAQAFREMLGERLRRRADGGGAPS